MRKRISRFALPMTAMIMLISGALLSERDHHLAHGQAGHEYECMRSSLGEVVDWRSERARSGKPRVLNYGTRTISSALPPYGQHAATAGSDDYLAAMVAGEGVGRWDRDRFPLKVYFEPGTRVEGYRPSFKAQMIDALNEWSNATKGKLSWKQVGSAEEADIICRWTDKVNAMKPAEAGFTMAMARNNGSSAVRTMGKASVTILTHYQGKVLSDESMRKVCLHELGHAWGMQGHSPFSDDIMYATTSSNQGDRLSPRDINSILNLYNGFDMRIGSR